MHPASNVREPVVQDLRRGQQTRTAVILRVLEHQEEVHVPDQNANEFHHAAAGDNHVECKQDPREIHGFELRAEPKVNNDVFVELAPNVEDAQDHGVHEEGNVHQKTDNDAADPVK